ncbi:hypothetical protein ARMSODRAFT_1091301 [Armillaria solidipes]|uniref:Uncharacterized protein n=1 Tax=Armillaria solidipes TaxID=1076256 RepID=A0A2H3B329_9AGAR|nr:hypothetical protein ARMSODRAFT_1091301 [Armillaria solidipes]
MVVGKKSTSMQKATTRHELSKNKARLAAGRAEREESVASQLEKAEQRRMKRNEQLRREAQVTATKLKAARHMIAISTPQDPNAKRLPKRRHQKKVDVQTEEINKRNLLIVLKHKKTVPGVPKDELGICPRCEKELIGNSKAKAKQVVYRMMIPRPYTPAVQYKKMKTMGVGETKTEILVANKYANRVNLATTWYHIDCLSEGQLDHIRKSGVAFGESIDEKHRVELKKKYKFDKVIESMESMEEEEVRERLERGEDDGEGGSGTG